MQPIYLDYNATTPIDPEVANAMHPYLTGNFGNPSSNHQYGKQAKQAIETAREQVAALINCEPSEIIFTSGGTESNNYAIIGTAFNLKGNGNHIITTCIEHPAVMEVCRYLKTKGFEISYLPVNEHGLISVDTLEKTIKPSTILITVMHANNEIGTIQPIEEIGELVKKYGIRFHTDAAQSIGKIEVNVQKTGVDLLSIAGHKFYAPKGIGALYQNRAIKLENLMHGANHEQNRRPGTENVMGIVGLGMAAEIAKRDLVKNYKLQYQFRELLYQKLKEKSPDIHLNGHHEKRLPNTLSIGLRGINANILLSQTEGIAASTGSACHAKDVELSGVLKAINLPPDLALGTIRFSTGKFLTQSDIVKASKIINDAIITMQK
jgi:cysteine desulfurase